MKAIIWDLDGVIAEPLLITLLPGRSLPADWARIILKFKENFGRRDEDILRSIREDLSSEEIEVLSRERKYFHCLISDRDVKRRSRTRKVFCWPRRNSSWPENCLVIEDTASGVEATKRAGMKCIAVTTTYPREGLVQANLIVDSLENLGRRDLALLLKDFRRPHEGSKCYCHHTNDK